MADLWRIELLGGLRAVRGERVVTRFDTRKAAALLALLALRPDRLHSREALAEQLWPDEEPEATRNRFKQVLSLLRKELEPPGTEPGSVLVTDRTHVRFASGAAITDVAEFEAALETARGPGGRLAALEKAVHVYKGELLPGFYEELILQERRRLAERHLDALESLAAALAEAGDFSAALDHARRAVSADPLREAAHALLMRVYAASGRLADAVRQYGELERALREQLDSAPSPSVRALLQQIRGQETRSAPPPLIQTTGAPPAAPAAPPVSTAPPLPAPPEPPRPLPAPLTRFFGREEELTRLLRLLAPNSTRLVTLMGPAGSGKSRLAIEAARRLRDSYGGHVWFIPLAAKADARAALDAIAEGLGISVPEDAALTQRIAGHLNQLGDGGAAPALVVLDNFEHLLADGGPDSEAAIMLRTLLEQSPGLACVVSSRQRVEVEGERVFPVLPLSTPAEGEQPSLERLRSLSSVRLFVDRAQAAEPFFELNEENGPAVAELCRRLDGIPLAIELAAAWSAELTPVQILARLSRRFELLVSRRRDMDSRHQSLRAALAWSYRQLRPALMRFYCGLSVFRGGCTLEAAETVALGFVRQGLPRDDSGALQLLSDLRARSMLEVDRTEDSSRYRLLETLREHASEEAAAGESYPELCRLHARCFLALAERGERELDGADQARWLGVLEADHDNIRAALRWSLSGDPELLGRLAAAMSEFWERRGHFHEGREWLERALEAPGLVGTARAGVLRGAGSLAWYRRDLRQAWDLLSEALPLYQAAGADRETAITLVRLGNVALSHERVGEAEALYWDALNLFRGLSEPAKTAWALRCLGHAKYRVADHEPAMHFFEQSLEICRRMGELRGIAASLTYIGMVTRAQGDLRRATEATKEALEIHRGLGDKSASASALDGLALIAASDARWERAHQLTTESIRLYREIGSPHGLSWLFNQLGHSLSELGRMQRATLLWGASIKADVNHPRRTEERLLQDPGVELTRSLLGEEAFLSALSQGKQLTAERAINVVFLGEPL